MTVALADLITAARLLLRDPDETTYDEDALTRAAAEAVAEYSRHRPAQGETTETVDTVDRRLDLEGLSELELGATTVTAFDIEVRAVEWPVPSYPRAYVRWTRWGNLLTLAIDRELVSEQLTLYFTGPHQLAGSDYDTLPADTISVLAEGTAGYALRALASSSSTALTLQPKEAERLRALADEHLAAFRNALPARAARQGVLMRPHDEYSQRDVVSWPD